jgi:hypothetical protein
LLRLLSEKGADVRGGFWLNGSMVTVQLPEQVQDVVLWMHARWVFDLPDDELEELGDALLAGVGDVRLDELESRAMERVWTDELERDIDDALCELEQDADRCRHVIERARLDLEIRRDASAVARGLLRQIAYQAANDRLPFMFCLCCLEERIQRRPGSARDAALETAAIAWTDAQITREELEAAARRCALNPAALPGLLAELLATDERRLAVRARLHRLAGFAARRQPELARELRSVLADPLPPDPRDDDLWVELCRGRADLELLPGFN